MLNRLTETIDFQARSLTLRADRERLIASNIANADTPGYLARDMNFSQALLDATGGAPKARALAVTQPGHVAQRSAFGGSTTELLYAQPSQTSLDRNSVDMDRERASFADNSVKYEATLRFIGGGVKTMLSAITGQ